MISPLKTFRVERGLGLEVNLGIVVCFDSQIIVLLAHRTLSSYPSGGTAQVAQLPLSFVFWVNLKFWSSSEEDPLWRIEATGCTMVICWINESSLFFLELSIVLFISKSS